jgi:hypothetical protein
MSEEDFCELSPGAKFSCALADLAHGHNPDFVVYQMLEFLGALYGAFLKTRPTEAPELRARIEERLQAVFAEYEQIARERPQ